MKIVNRLIYIVMAIGMIGTIVMVVLWTRIDTPEVESRGVLNIDGRTEIEPGVWSIKIPFELRNVSLDENVYTIRLEPGESGDIIVKIKEQGQGQVQVELATRVELR